MEFRWLKKGHGSDAIVVFGGWAVGAQVFEHLTGACDVLIASDYRDLNCDLPDLSAYGNVSLVAWSFGVASYAHWQQGRDDPFTQKVAVNGTLTPVSRRTGIPPVAMSKTIETLSSDAYQLFLARVFNARQPRADIDVTERREELLAIEARGDAPETAFDRILIGTEDKIFPAVNQVNAWPHACVQRIKAPHAPFTQYETWQEVLA